MTKQEKEKHKEKFEKALNEFVKDLKTYVSTDTGEWTGAHFKVSLNAQFFDMCAFQNIAIFEEKIIYDT